MVIQRQAAKFLFCMLQNISVTQATGVVKALGYAARNVSSSVHVMTQGSV